MNANTDAAKPKSPRETAQDKIVEYLTNSGYWTAPFGVLPGLDKVGKGKVRTITFGVARYLDCVCYIWAPNNITFDARGPLCRKFTVECFNSAEAAIAHLKSVANE